MLLVIIMFAGLIAAGVALGELEWPMLLGFLVVALGGAGVIALAGWPLVWHTALLAVLDVVLILWIFKGNLSLR